MATLTGREQAALRDLAKRYAEVAALDVQREKVAMWRALNRGEMVRPMVLIDQICWHEMRPEDELRLQVEHPYFRGVEDALRKALFKWNHMPVDMVVEPFIAIPRVGVNTGYGLRAEETIARTDAQNDIVSHSYVNLLREPDDADKIQDMRIEYDEAASARYFEQASALFADILPVRFSGFRFNLAVWDTLSELMGVQNAYLELIDRPEFVHRLMGRITDAALAGIEEANRLGVHDDIAGLCHCSHVYTDELLPAPGEGKGPHSKNSWAFGMAQLFSSVSPRTTQEFELAYFKRLAERFGMIYYGCCERLDDRLEMVLEIPNVRKISCSPWSRKEPFAEKIGRSVVMSNKPNPAFLAGNAGSAGLDAELVERDLRETSRAARRHRANLEFILKDISTVGGHPQKLFDWARLAMRVVEEG